MEASGVQRSSVAQHMGQGDHLVLRHTFLDDCSPSPEQQASLRSSSWPQLRSKPLHRLDLHRECKTCQKSLGFVDVVVFRCGHGHHKSCLQNYNWAYQCPREILANGDKSFPCPACKYKLHPRCPRHGIGRFCTDFAKGKCRRGARCEFCHLRHPSRERQKVIIRKQACGECDVLRQERECANMKLEDLWGKMCRQVAFQNH